MALKPHSPERLRDIASRFSAVADVLISLAKELEDLKADSLQIQSESVLNHRLVPIEDWIYRVRGEAEKQLRKLRREREAFQLGQQYAASKSAEKPQKTPGKRKK